MEAAASTSGLYTLSVSKVSLLPIPLAPLGEQEQIVNDVELRLSLLQAAESQIAANLKRSFRLCQSILKRAFEGKLVPQDPKDEPANVLLTRLKAQSHAVSPQKAKSKIKAKST
jgi:type I restriction enzyme S subunit